MSELQAELHRRERGVRKLERRREKLLGELSQIDVELASVGALSASGSVRRRPRNEMNLVDSLATVLERQDHVGHRGDPEGSRSWLPDNGGQLPHDCEPSTYP